MKAIVSIVTFALIMIFSALTKTWAGFSYFALVFSCLLCLFWLVILIVGYINEFRKIDEEEFQLFVAELINSTTLTRQQIEDDRKTYIKKFKRSKIREKAVEILKIMFITGVLASCIVLFFEI